ncbi:MAG TPA: barstar family protein [Candidatus Nanopelagicales bacterium]
MTNRIALWRDAPDADAAVELAALLDWSSVVIEVPEGGGRTAFFEACATAFGFPDYFGHNWDAFEECLSAQEFDEVEDLDDADGLLILWSGWGHMAEHEPEQFAVAVDVFRDVLSVWEEGDLAARVVLIGEGPKLSLAHATRTSAVFDDEDYELEEPVR